MEPKVQQRLRILALREKLSESVRSDESSQLDRTFIRIIETCKSEMIFIYSPIRGEYDPMQVMTRFPERIWCFPKIVNSTAGLMEFHHVHDPRKMVLGPFGSLEPVPRIHPQVTPDDKTLIIVPSVAVTLQGDRLGYGKGFYDRYLSLPFCQHVQTIALVFSCQVVDFIEVNKHDRRIGKVVSPEFLA